MRVIIAAAGPQTKWGGHLGLPSHLVPTEDGEQLLARTIRQARRLTDDVHVTASPAVAAHLVADGATCHVRDETGNEYTSTRSLWSATDQTVLLLGDVYFTDEAIDTIGRVASATAAYRCFGRYRASKHTGTPYGEIFAASWGPARHGHMDAHLTEVARLRNAGQCLRPAGWVLLRLWQGTPPSRHLVRRPIWVEIDDWTDDLDTPADHARHPAFGAAKHTAVARTAAGVRAGFAGILAGRGVRHLVHVGAHEGEEVAGYLDAGVERVTLVEPIQELAARLRQRFADLPGVAVVQAACGDEPGEAWLHIPARTNMASLLPLADDAPVRSEMVTVRRLDDIAPDADAAVVDAQGQELAVLDAAPWDSLRLLLVETCTVDDPSLSPMYERVVAYMTARGWRELTSFTRDYDRIQRWAFGRTTNTGAEVRDVVFVPDDEAAA